MVKERETVQVGGIVDGKLVMNIATSKLGVLRCQAGLALVGLRLRHGTALDYLQLGCAEVACTNGSCAWSRDTWPNIAGNSSHPDIKWGPATGSSLGGYVTIRQNCPPNAVITGFRATTNQYGRYAQDIQIECRPMGRLAPASFVNGTTVTPTSSTGKTLPQRVDDLSGRDIPMLERATHTASCNTGSVTAVSVAVANYGVLRTPVVQAFSFYCAGDSTAGGDPELLELARQLKRDMEQLKGMAATAGDHFYFGVCETLIGTLEWMATNDTIANSVSQFLQLFTLPDEKRNKILLDMGQQAWDMFRTDPARFLGQNAQDLIPTAKIVSAAKEAAMSVRGLNKMRGEFGQLFADIGKSRFNPKGSTTNCFACAVQYDRTMQTGRMNVAPDTARVSSDEAFTFLRQHYGHLKLDPGYKFNEMGRMAHRFGEPIEMTRQEIESALMAMTEPKARGIVFVGGLNGGTGHVFNVVKNDAKAPGRVVFINPQGSFAVTDAGFFPPGAKVYFYRTN